MFDGKKLLDQFLGGQGGPQASNQAKMGNIGGIAGGAVAGGLVGLLTGTKTGRKIGKNVVTYGGMALLGGLAYKAWTDWQSGKTASTGQPSTRSDVASVSVPPAGSPFFPASGNENDLVRSLIRAMIGAAKADGHIDAGEQKRIFKRVNEMNLGAEEKAFVMDELARPLDVNAVAAGASSPETAAEIYAASLIAIDPNGPAERGYLSMLAARLKLDPSLLEHLHATVNRVMA